MKRFLATITLILMLTATAATPILAAENFDGPSAGTFGRPTSVEPDTIFGGPATEADNMNRSKDSAIAPPSFGSPGSYMTGAGNPLTPGLSGGTSAIDVNSGNGAVYVPADSGGAIPSLLSAESPAQSTYSNKFTLPDGLYYSDGSIGVLSIPKLGVTAKVYEEESLENLKKGVGHFKSTSCWDGNVGFAAHNRGLADYFGQIHTLKNGDKIVYTTKLGTRTYEVCFVGQIQETDFSRLGRADENLVTLTTCVRDVPELRWCVQARQIP